MAYNRSRGFNGSNNNGGKQFEKTNVNSTIVRIYNEQAGQDSGVLTLGYWNDRVMMTINPALAPNKQVDGKKYNYDVKMQVSVTAGAVNTIYYGLRLLNAGKIKNFAVKVSATSMVKVGLSSEFEGMSGKQYLGLFNIDDNEVQTNGIFFVFDSPNIEDLLILDWNEEDGSSSGEIAVESPWASFGNFIKQAAEGLVSGTSHGAAFTVATQLKEIKSGLEALKGIAGIEAAGSQENSRPQATNRRRGSSNNFSSSQMPAFDPGTVDGVSDVPFTGGELGTPAKRSSSRTNRNAATSAKEERVNNIHDLDNMININPSSIDIDLDDLD